MNTKNTWAVLTAVLVVLGIGNAGSRFSFLGSAWGQHPDSKDDGHDEGTGGDEHHEEEGVVHLDATQRAGLKLTPVEVRRGSLTAMVELPGEISWNTDRLVHITPRVGGLVASVEKTLGDRVEVGDVLCVLDSREMGNAKMEYLADLSRFEVAQADYERAQTVFENTKQLLAILAPEPEPEAVLAEAHDLPVGENKNKLLTTYTRMKVNLRNYKRNEELLASKIASEAEFLSAKGEYEVSRADYLSTREEISFDLKLRFLRAQKDFQVARTDMRNSERALHILGLTNEQTVEIAKQGEEVDENISRSTLYSPIAGRIVDRHLTRGEQVTTGTPLYKIADLSDVWVMGRAYERDIRFLKPGQKATVRIDAFPEERFEGQVDYVASQLDTDSRTVQIRVVLENLKKRLRAGMFGTVIIHATTGADAANRKGLLVPSAALQRMTDGFVVFRIVEPGEYQLVPVEVRGKNREFAEVTGELSVGDQVVVGDTFVLKSEAGKGEMGEGHEH